MRRTVVLSRRWVKELGHYGISMGVSASRFGEYGGLVRRSTQFCSGFSSCMQGHAHTISHELCKVVTHQLGQRAGIISQEDFPVFINLDIVEFCPGIIIPVVSGE